jgi:DNA-directed RNA polymerase subunit omega
MARITVEDCLKQVNNRFALIHMVAKRVRQLRKGDEPSISSKNRDIVIALREIAAGKIHGVKATNTRPAETEAESTETASEDAGVSKKADNG